jgi:hypothetical protein
MGVEASGRDIGELLVDVPDMIAQQDPRLTCVQAVALSTLLATKLSQEITASIVFFSALGWVGDRGALARASSSLAPIS